MITKMWTLQVSPQGCYPIKVCAQGGHTPATEPGHMLQENNLLNLPKHLVVSLFLRHAHVEDCLLKEFTL